jgi:hypothetical protein
VNRVSGTIEVLAALTLLSGRATALAAPRPAVIELFTSQGCSSCPPADALLGELAGRDDVIALAFHVDYWDNLGWRDRFELPLAAQRQERYVRALGLTSAFTPQVVLDGRRSFVGSDRPGITTSLDSMREGIALHAQVKDRTLVIELGSGAPDPSDVCVVALLPRAESRIGKGENSGRTLTEFNIVRAYLHAGTWLGAPARFEVPLSSVPADATEVAVLVQHQGQGEILGAALVRLE